MDRQEFAIRLFVLVIITLFIGIVVTAFDHICASVAAVGVWGILAIVLLTDD